MFFILFPFWILFFSSELRSLANNLPIDQQSVYKTYPIMTFDGGYRVFSGGHPVQVEHAQFIYLNLVTIKPFTDLQTNECKFYV